MSLNAGYLPTIFTSTITKNYVNFNGRTSRHDYWHWFLAYLLFAIIVGAVATMLGKSGEMLSNLISLALLLPSLGIGARRLHDTGKSGWWQLVMLTGIGIFLLIFFWAQPGEGGPNAHGDVPPTEGA